MSSPSDPLRSAASAIARASDPADVVGALAQGLLRTCSGGCVIELFVPSLPRVPFVGHNQRELVARMRDARGADLLEQSALVARALSERRALVSSFGQQTDPVERVRLALRADTATVLPLVTGPETVGAIALFGRPLREELLAAVELLAAAAAATIDRLILARSRRSELAVRDASIAMLTSLAERSPIPTAFLDAELRVVAANDAFAAAQRATHDQLFRRTLDELDVPDRAAVRRLISDALARGEARLTEIATTSGPIGERSAMLVSVHPVVADSAITAVGVSLVDLSGRQRAEDSARALADGSAALHAAPSVRAAHEALIDLAIRWLGPLAILDGGFCRPAAAESSLRSLIAALPAELSPSRARATNVPLSVPADEIALLALSNERLRASREALGCGPMLHVPIGESVLTIARAHDDFAPEEIALAVDLSRIAHRALEGASAREEVRTWTLLFADFLGMVSRDLRDPITALIARLFVVQHGPSEDFAQHLPALRANAERLRDIAQRILGAAPRPPSGSTDAIDLAELVSEASAGALTIAEARAARVLVQHAPSSGVVGDRRRLFEALRDVMVHAAGETPPAGLFCVRTESTAHEITVTVSHNGEGLAAPDARRVFDALWDGRPGGRALTVARAVFAAHGGRSWVETAPGTGTAYCFALPVEAVSSTA